MNMLKKGYSNRKSKSFAHSLFEYEVGEKVLLNTNISDKTKLPRTILPIWGALGVVERKRSAYSYVVAVISAKYNKHNKKRVSAGKSVIMDVKYVLCTGMVNGVVNQRLHRDMRLAPDMVTVAEMDNYLSDVTGDQIYVYDGVDGMKYVTEEDGTKSVRVLVRWNGFPFSEATWEDPVEGGLCSVDEVDTFIAGLMDLTKQQGKPPVLE